MNDLYEALNDAHEQDQVNSLSESSTSSALEELKSAVAKLASDTGLEIYISGAEEDGESADLFCTEMFDVAGTGLITVLEYEGGEYEFEEEEIIAHLRDAGLLDSSYGDDIEDDVRDYIEYNYIDEESGIDSMIEQVAQECLSKGVEELTDEEKGTIRKVLVDYFELDEALTEDTEMSRAVQMGINKAVSDAKNLLDESMNSLEASLVEYFDKYKQELESEDAQKVRDALDSFITYVNVRAVDMVKAFKDRLN